MERPYLSSLEFEHRSYITKFSFMNTQYDANRYSITLSSFNCSILHSWMCSEDVLMQAFFWQKGYLHQLQKFVPSTYIKSQTYSKHGISFIFLTTGIIWLLFYVVCYDYSQRRNIYNYKYYKRRVKLIFTCSSDHSLNQLLQSKKTTQE